MAATILQSAPELTGDGFSPAVPHSLDELGIARRTVSDIFLRRVYIEGTTTLRSVSRSLKLSPVILDRIYRHLAHEKLLDVRAATEDDCTFSLTRAGQRLAASRMKVTQYVGPAPVSITDYCAGVLAQKRTLSITRDHLAEAFSDLVLTDELLSDLGPALTSQAPLFLYGPTGSGKTAIAERLHRLYSDTVLIPYAVEVDTHIIALHDPIVHQPAGEQPDDVDPRWVRCRRPFLVVGGELTADQLELRLDDSSRVYAAPVQMKANLGMLVIDDFGRQVISPRKILNRWILPIDRHIDLLALRHGVKFQIPFELSLVFSTNLDPHSLADAAFLRRLPNKIFVGDISEQVFDGIFERAARQNGLKFNFEAAKYVRQLCAHAGCAELRACLPGDLCRTAASIVRFEGNASGDITPSHLDRAVRLYFAATSPFRDVDFNAGPATVRSGDAGA
jgi:hypothetical protein